MAVVDWIERPASAGRSDEAAWHVIARQGDTLADSIRKQVGAATADSNHVMVVLPDDGWEDGFKSYLHRMSEALTPWWWAFEHKRGNVHYLFNVGIEEIMPDFLCGLQGDNLWPAVGHQEEERCPNCLRLANEQGLPLFLEGQP